MAYYKPKAEILWNEVKRKLKDTIYKLNELVAVQNAHAGIIEQQANQLTRILNELRTIKGQLYKEPILANKLELQLRALDQVCNRLRETSKNIKPGFAYT